MTDNWPHDPDVAMVYVEHFFRNSFHDEVIGEHTHEHQVALHRYIVTFVDLTPAYLCTLIADTISDCAHLGIPMDRMQGFVFLNSIIHAAVDEEAAIGFIPVESWQPRPDDLPWLLFHSPPEGGVQVGYGDPDPWDPTLWQLRFGRKEAS